MSVRLARWRVLAVMLICAAAGRVPASISLSFDILDASDPGWPAPPGILVVDAFVDVTPDVLFVIAGVTARTFNNATLTYFPELPDPNAPRFFPPGTDHRHVTFGSVAYDRDVTARYEPAGTVAEQTIGVAGGYEGDAALFTPTRLNVVYQGSPPATIGHPDAPLGRDGYVLRISLDISQVTLPGGSDPGNYRLFTPGTEPGGYQPVLISQPERPGTEWGTIANQTPFGLAGANWGIYVPEPAPLAAILVVGGLAGCWRRSASNWSE